MRLIVLFAKMMMRAMASIPILAVIYVIVYFLITGVSAVSTHTWLIIGLALAAVAICIGIIYAGWAFHVPIKRAIHSAQKRIRLSYFENTAKFAYERLFEKANEYIKLWRSSSGKINLFSIFFLPVRFFVFVSIYIVGFLVLSIAILLFAPIQAWIFKSNLKGTGAVKV
ncbi:MAG TPA: hypothetical protein PK629_10060 [Oscillospiraceae bacterium]|nr:hypothetical protein [Oscillospiraceae bacterium]HPF56547.1 hypothetical protein [Clostridiales bacterium]HPK36535.1 hypothetical protein [Oscillospiraceae bacterium]HPR75512.1 hypothetical protein [Oscillospiraceae bacterium]